MRNGCVFRGISAYFGHWVYFGLSSNRPKCTVEIVLINNLGFKVLIVNSGTKYMISNMRKDIN